MVMWYVYDWVMEARGYLHSRHFRTIEVMANLLASASHPGCQAEELLEADMEAYRSWRDYGRRVLAHVGEYMDLYFDPDQGKLKEQLLMYKSFKVFHPAHAKAMGEDLDADKLETILEDWPLTKQPEQRDLVPGLKDELGTYLAELESDDSIPAAPEDNFDPVAWYFKRRSKLPAFIGAVRLMGLYSPTSCACERVLSWLNDLFDAKQGGALNDYIEAALMSKAININGRH